MHKLPGPAAGLTEESIKFACLQPGSITTAQHELLKDYCSSLMHNVRQHWNPPKCEAGNKVVAFTVSATGDISTVRLEKSSGVPMCDKAALDAVVHSAPFSAFPSGIQQIRIELNFGGKWKQDSETHIPSQPGQHGQEPQPNRRK